MKFIHNLALLSLFSLTFFSCSNDDDGVNPSANNVVTLEENEHFDATWNVSSSGNISSMAFTSDGLATIQGSASGSSARITVEEKDLLFVGDYTVQSDTIIDLEGYGTIKVLNNDGEIQIELIKEDNPSETISFSVEVDNTTYSERTAFLANTWKEEGEGDDDDFFVFFTKDGSLLTNDGNGVWEWTNNSEDVLKVKIEDEIFELNVLSITEENASFSMTFTEENETYTDTVNLVRVNYEDLIDNIDGLNMDRQNPHNGSGYVSINGEEIFKIRGAAARNEDAFENDTTGRFYDFVFLQDLTVLDEIDTYEGESFLSNMMFLTLTTSARNPENLAGDYSNDVAWDSENDAASAPDYGVQFAGILAQINNEFSIYAKSPDSENLNIEKFIIEENEDGTFMIDAIFEIQKLNQDETLGEKVNVRFHYEGDIFIFEGGFDGEEEENHTTVE